MLLIYNVVLVLEKRWFLLYSKPRQELKLARELTKRSVENYCPTLKTIKQWSDRKKKIEEPLFRSYVFIRIDLSERELVYQIPGFSRFVFWLGKPVIIRDQEINATKDFLNKVVHDSILIEKFKVGQDVRVGVGPMQNQTGKLIRIKGQHATLQLETLGTIVHAKIALSDLLV